MSQFTVGQLVNAVRATGPLNRGDVATVHAVNGDKITIKTLDGQTHTDDDFMFFPEDDTIVIVASDETSD